MKKILKRISAVACALCVAVSVAAGASAVEATNDLEIQSYIVSGEMRNSIAPMSVFWDENSIYLPRSDHAGTKGVKCGSFEADTDRVLFTLVEATNTLTYNVQLYYESTDERAKEYEDINVGDGIVFRNLKIGERYYFKVSSNDCPSPGVNALFSVETI